MTDPCRRPRPTPAVRGVTLVELLVTIAAFAILTSLAYPSYTQHVFRSRAVDGTNALAALAVRLEQRFQDVGGYGQGAEGKADGACGVGVAPAPSFELVCAATGGGTRFLATATGRGPTAGVVYTIDDAGVRRTTAHPRGVPSANCWSIRGATCDT